MMLNLHPPFFIFLCCLTRMWDKKHNVNVVLCFLVGNFLFTRLRISFTVAQTQIHSNNFFEFKMILNLILQHELDVWVFVPVLTVQMSYCAGSVIGLNHIQGRLGVVCLFCK